MTNVSEYDFVKWQKHRQEQEELIQALTTRVRELTDEVAYWQRQAMNSGNRD